jgi:VanZ family protein
MTLVALWLPVAAYMAVLFMLSAQPELPSPGGSPDWLQHGVAYAGLALVTVRATATGAWSRVGARTIAGAALIAIVYSAFDEWHQSFVPGRTADLYDLAADAAGAALALCGAWAWSIIRSSP